MSFFDVVLGASAVPLGWLHTYREELRALQESRVGMNIEERMASVEGIIDRYFGKWGAASEVSSIFFRWSNI